MDQKLLFLDCEFNGYQGELISLAMYDPSGRAPSLFCELDLNTLTKPIEEFVKLHVIPNMDNTMACYCVNRDDLNKAVCDYLLLVPGYTIIADWAEDFIHLLACTAGPNGLKRLPYLKLQLVTTPDVYVSHKPHNALADAMALSKNYKYMKEAR